MKELCLVGRHVHPDRALGRTGFAREAQVKRLVDAVGLPGIGYDATVEHLGKHPGTAAGTVHLLRGRPVGRAHATTGALAAGTHAGAATQGLAQVAVVVRVEERQVSPERGGVLGAQLSVEWVRVDKHSRIQHATRIERVLEGAERLEDSVPVHAAQQL